MTTSNERDGGLWAQVRPYLDRVGPSLDLLVKVIAVGWSLSLLAGGLIFLVYFWSIGFMPEMDLKAFATLLVFSALAGGFLLILLSVCLLAPGLSWGYWVTSSETLKSLVYNEQKAPSRRAALWFGVPLGCAVASLFILDLIHIRPQEWGNGTVALIALATSLLIGLLATAGLLWITLPDHLHSKQRLKTALKLYAVLVLSLWFFWLGPFFLLDKLIGAVPDSATQAPRVFLFVASMGFILMLNAAFVASRPFSSVGHLISRYLLFTAIALVFLLNGGAVRMDFIPKGVMYVYKFGSFAHTSLVLDQDGCAIVQLHQLPNLRTFSQQNMCILVDVTILSRLGTMYYVEDNVSKDTSVRFTIPTQHVLSWTVTKATMQPQ